jgi:serine/threonine protein kinase
LEVTLRDTGSTLSPEKWPKVRDIYAQALSEPLEQRVATVLLLSEGDRELESEVVSLLAAHENAGSFLAEPAMAAFDVPIGAEATRDLEIGTVLNKRFEIQRFLNSGGMGSVYEAWDCELEEMVALKTILPDIASEPSVIQYFKEEVKQARQVSHLSICRVYDLFCHQLDDGEQVWFLTMQLLEGRTLREWLLEEGPFLPKDAISLIDQLVSGLAAAHELGVVHRDIKSSNIILIPAKNKTLRPVITDFGLAVRITDDRSESHKPRGQGSEAYAAPEQWHEGIVGPAADQYSLGVVMCEMITGKRPALTRASDGSFSIELPNDSRLKGRWEAVIRRCLEIRPEDRFSSVAAIMPALDPSRRRRAVARRMTMAAAAVVLVVTVFLLTTATLRKPTIRNLKQLTPIMDLSTSPSLSRDGTMIAYASDRSGSGGPDIWVQHLPDGIPLQITDDPAGDEDPSLSPDGRSVVFASTRDRGGIYFASTEGGPAKLLAQSGRNPRFSPDGRSVLYWTGDDNRIRATGRVYIVDLAAGRTTRLAPEFTDARDAIWNSDGHHILFKGCPSGRASVPACWDWWVTTTDGQAPRDTNAMALLASRKLTLAGEFGGWYGDAVLFTAASGRAVHLWELTVSPTSLVVGGQPRELTPGDAREKIISSSLADGDVLALTDLSSAIHVWRIEHADTPATAKPLKVTQDAEMDIDPSISPNGRWLTFARGASVDRQLWIRDMLSGKERVLSTPGSDKFSPIVDDAGTTVTYEAWQNGVPSILMEKPGLTALATVCRDCRTPTGWFDGDVGLLVSDAAISRVEMYRPATLELQTILRKPGVYISDATWSAANQFILFTVSNDSGRGQVFAAHFPRGASMPDSNWIPISSPSESVQKPRWSGDGKTIYYLSDRDKWWCVWGRSFDPAVQSVVGEPVAVQHYHSHRFSPDGVSSHSFNLSVAGDSVYLVIAEMSGTIWIGTLDRAILPSIADKF